MLINLTGGQYGGEVREIADNLTELSIKDEYDRIWHYNLIVELNKGLFAFCELPSIDKTSIEYLQYIDKCNKQKDVWELIKSERDRLKFSGVKLSDGTWFHSDPDSRSQQLGLFVAAIAGKLPQNIIMWKTLTVGGGLYDNVEVPMNTELAIDIFVTTMMHDATFHAASGYHREQLLLADDPLTYNYKSNWPESFESYRNQHLALTI